MYGGRRVLFLIRVASCRQSGLSTLFETLLYVLLVPKNKPNAFIPLVVGDEASMFC